MGRKLSILAFECLGRENRGPRFEIFSQFIPFPFELHCALSFWLNSLPCGPARLGTLTHPRPSSLPEATCVCGLNTAFSFSTHTHWQRKHHLSISLSYKNKLHMALLSCDISFLLFNLQGMGGGRRRLRLPLQTSVPRVSSESSRVITPNRAPVRLATPSRYLKNLNVSPTQSPA